MLKTKRPPAHPPMIAPKSEALNLLPESVDPNTVGEAVAVCNNGKLVSNFTIAFLKVLYHYLDSKYLR